MIKDTKEGLTLSKAVNPKFFYGYVVALAAFSIYTIVYGAYLTFGIFFKPLLEDFGWTRAMTSGAYSINLLLHGFLGIIMGRLTDRFGPKITVLVFGSFLGLGYMLMSQISTIWHFYLVYGVVMGIGMSPILVPTMATIARWFVKRRGLITGIASSGVNFGQVIMLPIAAWLILAYGWRQSYIIVGFIALLVIIISGLFLKRDPGQIGQRPYGADEVGEQGVKEQGSSLPPGEFSLRKAALTRQFWMLWVMFFSFGFGRSALAVHIAPFVTDLGFSLTVGASILAAAGGPAIVGRLVMGGFADRIGNRQALRLGFILMAAATLWLLVAKELWMLYLFAVIFGFSWGGLACVIRAPMAAEVFGLGSLGLTLGIVEFGAAVGGAVGPFLAGWIFDASGSYQLAFLITAATAIASALITSLLRPIGK